MIQSSSSLRKFITYSSRYLFQFLINNMNSWSGVFSVKTVKGLSNKVSPKFINFSKLRFPLMFPCFTGSYRLSLSPSLSIYLYNFSNKTFTQFCALAVLFKAPCFFHCYRSSSNNLVLFSVCLLEQLSGQCSHWKALIINGFFFLRSPKLVRQN